AVNCEWSVEEWGRALLAEGARALGIEPSAAGDDPAGEVREALNGGIPCLVFDEELQDYALLTGDRADGYALRAGRSVLWRPWRELSRSRTWLLRPGTEADPMTAFKHALERLVDGGQPGVLFRTRPVETADASRLAGLGALLAQCKLQARPYIEELGRSAGSAAIMFDDAADALERSGQRWLEAIDEATAGHSEQPSGLIERAIDAEAKVLDALVALRQALSL